MKSGRTKKREEGRDPRSLVLTPALLRRRFRLPHPDDDDDKEQRGRVLVVGGAVEMPGALILAATAALRAGAGKLQIAAGRSISPLVAMAVPESRVFALPETRAGALSPAAAEMIAERAGRAQALLIGPGMIDEETVKRLMKRLLPRLDGAATVVLDAAALSCVAKDASCLHRLKGQVVLTPHAGEMANLSGVDKEVIEADPLEAVLGAVSALGAVVALKGRETLIAAPAGENVYCNRAGNVGLATSGSGDTLSGVIAGLAARGAQPFQAAVWGVYLHARAGDTLARRVAPLGFLARELLAEIPPLMSKLSARGR